MRGLSRIAAIRIVVAVACAALVAPAGAVTYVADPSASPGDADYYRTLVDRLQPGDTLELPAGTYRERLNLQYLEGRPDAWITITGPASGDPAIITTESLCCNTVQLGNTAYVAIENLVVDSNSEALGGSIDAINAKDAPTHDIRIENCTIRGVSYHQATVGISTKSTAWNWTIRGNTIDRAGTGLYLGLPTGGAPFIAGVIESNLVIDTIGYNMQIKHQRPYTPTGGMPAGPNRTIIRNNVFLKRVSVSEWPPLPGGGSRVTGPRPNVLIGGFPDTGTGSSDLYEIYGNFFHANPDESLLQASGRATIHDNIFTKDGGTAVVFQNHDAPLRLAYVYSNTIYGADRGIRFSSTAGQDDAVVGNLVFAPDPISGSYRAANARDNLTDTVAGAATHVVRPSLVLGDMDFYPRAGRAQGSPLDLSRFAADTDLEFDFNGDPKGDRRFRGAYAGEDVNPGWALTDALKVGGPSAGGGGPPDPVDPPPAPTGLQVL